MIYRRVQTDRQCNFPQVRVLEGRFVCSVCFSVTLEGPCTHFSTGLHVLQEAYLNQGNTALMLRDCFTSYGTR